MKLEGVILPVTTPFDGVTGDPAPVSFRANLRAWLEQGVHGFVLAGSTGEAPLLGEGEILSLAEWARDVVPPERILIAGVGAESTRATIRLARVVAEVGVDAVLVRAPSYYRGLMNRETVGAHFERVADEIPVPLILYHVPQYVPVEITTGLVSDLADHPNVVGIKDSTGDLKSLAGFLDAAPQGFRVLVGSGAKLYGGLEVGAAGGIVAAGCIAAARAVEVYERFREGAMAEAGAAQAPLARVHESIVKGHGVPGVKYALDLLGLAGGDPRAPLRPLPEPARAEVRAELDAAGLLAG